MRRSKYVLIILCWLYKSHPLTCSALLCAAGLIFTDGGSLALWLLLGMVNMCNGRKLKGRRRENRGLSSASPSLPAWARRSGNSHILHGYHSYPEASSPQFKSSPSLGALFSPCIVLYCSVKIIPPPTPAQFNSQHLLSHIVSDSRVALAQGLSWSCIRMWVELQWSEAWLGLEDLVPSSWTWLLADGPRSLPCGLLQSVAWVSYQKAAGFPKNKRSERENKEEAQAFQSQESHPSLPPHSVPSKGVSKSNPRSSRGEFSSISSRKE